MSGDADELGSILDSGFGGKQLEAFSQAIPDSPLFDRFPGPMLILSSVARGLSLRWEGGPILTTQALAIQGAFEHPFRQLLQAAASGNEQRCWEVANYLARRIVAGEPFEPRG